MPAALYQSFMGIAKEATRGTGVAATAFPPVKTQNLTDHQMFAADTGLRGSAVNSYGQIATVTYSEYDFGGDVFADTIGFPLAGVLGDVVTTGASAPYSHVIAVKNSTDMQPTSYSLTDFDGYQARQVTAAQFAECNFVFNADGLLEYSAKAMGNISAAVSTPTRSFTAITPYANYQAVVTVGGGSILTLIDGTCDIKRPVNPVHTMDQTANAYRLWAGAVTVSGKLSFITETGETQLLNYLNNTQPSLDLNFTQGTGPTLTQVKLHMTKCAYLTAGQTRGKDWIQTDVTYEAVANTTDVGASAGYGQLVATLQNANAASTYV